MQPDALRLLAALARLKTDRATGDPAPHKPLLLLALFDLIESGRVVPPVVGLTADLGYQFLRTWPGTAGGNSSAAGGDARPYNAGAGSGGVCPAGAGPGLQIVPGPFSALLIYRRKSS
jgi:hypothetical protein